MSSGVPNKVSGQSIRITVRAEEKFPFENEITIAVGTSAQGSARAARLRYC